MLTKDEELNLINAWQTRRDQRAFNAILDGFAPWIGSNTAKLARRANWMHIDDIRQIVTLAIFHAVDTFDPTAGARLVTHTQWQLRGLVTQHITRTDRGYAKKRNGEKILSDAADLYGVDDYGLALHEKIAAPEPDFNPDEYNLSALIASAPLNRKELEAITGRANDRTLQEIATEMGVTRERVRQLEAAAIQKIRKNLSQKSIQRAIR